MSDSGASTAARQVPLRGAVASDAEVGVDYDPEPEPSGESDFGGERIAAATRRPSTLEQYATFSMNSDTEATSVSAYDSDASVDEDEAFDHGAPSRHAHDDRAGRRGHGDDATSMASSKFVAFQGPHVSETDESSDYGQHMLASESYDDGSSKDEIRPAHRRRVQWGPSKCCVSYKIGALRVIADYHNEQGDSTKLMLGPYWPYMVVTAVTVSVITTLVYSVVVPAAYPGLKATGVVLAALSIVFLFCTAMADPGVFKRHPQPLGPDWTYAEFADSYRPPGTIYCHMTKVLIEGYDHFCPWSGTVIGKKNMIWFQLWVFTLVLALLLDFILLCGFLAGANE